MSTSAILMGLVLVAAVAGNCLLPITQNPRLKQFIAVSFALYQIYTVTSLWHLSEDLHRLEREMVPQSHMKHEIRDVWLPQIKNDMQETWEDIVHKSWKENIANGGWIKHWSKGEPLDDELTDGYLSTQESNDQLLSE